MDESPKPILMHVHEPLPLKPGMTTKIDAEYIRCGVAEMFLAIEPLTGHWKVDVTEKRTKVDWAKFIKELVDEVYPQAEKIILVMDNLNIHKISSLYEAFPAKEAHRIAKKIAPCYTPKHGSWLNIAEIGFSNLQRQCVPARVGSVEKLRKAIEPYVAMKNASCSKIDWQFKTEDARIKLKRLYPKL